MAKDFGKPGQRATGDAKKKLLKWAVWIAGVDRLDCPTCEFTHAEFDSMTPCSTCKPRLRPENVVVLEVYSQCSGAIPVDPFRLMEIKGIEDQEYCLNNVQFVAAEIKRVLAEKRGR